MASSDYELGYAQGHAAGYEEGCHDGRREGQHKLEDVRRKAYEAGVESMKDDFDKGYEEGVSDTCSEYEKREAGGRYTVTMSAGLFTAYRASEPGIFETSAVSAYDALGRLVARLTPVRTLGRIVL